MELRTALQNWPMGILDPDAGEEADQDRAGDEVREESEAREAREEQGTRGRQRAQAGESQPLRRPRLKTGDPETGDAGEEDRRGGGVRRRPPRWSSDDPNTAKARIGNRIVYSPVITGVPAIFVYPMTSGIASDASVMSATTSCDSQARLYGRMLPRREWEGRFLLRPAPRLPGRPGCQRSRRRVHRPVAAAMRSDLTASTSRL